jgi:hypothetical protein
LVSDSVSQSEDGIFAENLPHMGGSAARDDHKPYGNFDSPTSAAEVQKLLANTIAELSETEKKGLLPIYYDGHGAVKDGKPIWSSISQYTIYLQTIFDRDTDTSHTTSIAPYIRPCLGMSCKGRSREWDLMFHSFSIVAMRQAQSRRCKCNDGFGRREGTAARIIRHNILSLCDAKMVDLEAIPGFGMWPRGV